MRFLLANHFHNAYQSLRANRLRSALTMLGVTIGVASITAILALSSGASQLVTKQVDALDGTLGIIRTADLPLSNINPSFVASSLTSTDVDAVAELQGVSDSAPLSVIAGAVTANDTTPNTAIIVASTPALEKVNELELQDGQFLTDRLSDTTAVIGPQLSVALYGTEQSIGKTLSVKGKSFTIVGVLDRTNTPFNFNNIDFDNAIIIPQQAAEALSPSGVQVQQINFRVQNADQLGATKQAVEEKLLQTHLGQRDFTVLTGDAIAEPTSRLFQTIALVTAAVAAISLLVGGIGIMNILLVNVAERTREIGIRKAVGASTGDIAWQFLIESLALSIGGGIAGFGLGYVLAYAASTFLPFAPAFTWSIAGIGLLMSLIVGVIFGLYPAIKAARKDPIASLRQYD